MRARVAEVVAPRRLQIVDKNLREPDTGEVLIKVKMCGLCHTDMAMYEGRKGPIQRRVVGDYEHSFQEDNPSFPYVIGHEAAGIIEAVGPGVSRFKVGDRVAGPVSGGFATYTLVSTKRLIHLPDNIPMEMGLAEPLTCATGIVRAANPEIGDYVAVIGAGFMGLLVGAALCKHPIRELIAVDLVDERLEWARKIGATVTLNPRNQDVLESVLKITGGRGVDIAIDITGRYSGLALAIDVIRKGRGKILIPSYYGGAETVDFGAKLASKSPIIHSTHPPYFRDYVYDMETGLWATAEGIYPITQLITHKFSLDEINEAFEVLAANPEGYIKGVVLME